MPADPRLRELVEQLVQGLFTNGQGQRAERLVLMQGTRDLGGWCQAAIVDRIVEALCDRDRSALLAEVARLRAERENILVQCQKTVDFHRDMAERFAEDRDIQKHRAREAETDLTRLRDALSSYCEAHHPPHDSCPCCEAVRADDECAQLRDALAALRDEMHDEYRSSPAIIGSRRLLHYADKLDDEAKKLARGGSVPEGAE